MKMRSWVMPIWGRHRVIVMVVVVVLVVVVSVIAVPVVVVVVVITVVVVVTMGGQVWQGQRQHLSMLMH